MGRRQDGKSNAQYPILNPQHPSEENRKSGESKASRLILLFSWTLSIEY